jgi:hypothetical protein
MSKYLLPTVDVGTFLVLRTDGAEEIVRKKPSITHLLKAIGAHTLDFVAVGRASRSDLMMAVDDSGYETELVDHGNGRLEMKPVRATKPFNAKATALYHAVCQPGTTHQIVGDVALVHDADFA